MVRIGRSFRPAAFVALLGFAPCAPLAAQVLTPGTRVRVSSSELVAPIIGNYQGVRRDTVMVIEDGQGAQVWNFPTATIDRFEVSAGMKGGNRGPITRGALIGAGIGGALGWVTAIVLENNSRSRYNAALSTVVGAGIGAVAGGFYGSRIVQERWTAVQVPHRISIAPTRTGVRLGFAAAF